MKILAVVYLTLCISLTVSESCKKHTNVSAYPLPELPHYYYKGQGKIIGPIHLNDSNYVVFPYTGKEFFATENARPVVLSKKEIDRIETLINYSIKEYNSHTESELIDKKSYKVQLVPHINEKGEKIVWVNCFCHSHSNWRKGLIAVDDGGSCFFNLKINLTISKCYDFEVNGDA